MPLNGNETNDDHQPSHLQQQWMDDIGFSDADEGSNTNTDTQQSHLRMRWMEDLDLVHDENGDVVGRSTRNVLQKMRGLINYASAQCNANNITKVIPAKKLQHLIASARLGLAKFATVDTLGEEERQALFDLEEVAATARGRRNNAKSLELLLADVG